MNYGSLSEQIRQRAVQKYIRPALEGGRNRFSIEVKSLMVELEAEGFPPNHPAQFCSAVQKQTFLMEHGLEIERIDGPPSKKSTTVVVHYRVIQPRGIRSKALESAIVKEDSAAWAERVTKPLIGLLKEELAEYGGADGFIRWIRSDDEYPG